MIEAHTNTDDVIDNAKYILENVDFNTIVGTGLSGALIIPRMAEALDVHWAIVRKPNESSHSDAIIEGMLGTRWLFVDDLIESGSTLDRIKSTMLTLCNLSITAQYYAVHHKWRTKYVGAYFYGEANEAGVGFFSPGNEGDQRYRNVT